MCDTVWRRGGQNWSKMAWRTLWTAPIIHLSKHEKLGNWFLSCIVITAAKVMKLLQGEFNILSIANGGCLKFTSQWWLLLCDVDCRQDNDRLGFDQEGLKGAGGTVHQSLRWGMVHGYVPKYFANINTKIYRFYIAGHLERQSMVNI